MLKTHRNFHDRVHLIKKQISLAKHPLHVLIKTFKRKFYKENMNLLKKSNESEDGTTEESTRAMSMNSELALQRQAKECNR